MSQCCEIVDLLPDYLLDKSTKSQNSNIIRHISVCPSCRRDLALWIAAQQAIACTEVPVPSDINMFAKLPVDRKTRLELLLETKSVTMAYDVVRYVFETVRQTYRLANSFEGDNDYVRLFGNPG